MMNDRGHLSSETIDLLMLSALSAGEANQAKTHIDDCKNCRERWRELNEDKQRFEQFVFPRTVQKVEERLRKKSLFERFGFKLLIPAFGAVAAGLIAVAAVGPAGVTETEDDLYVGIKGAEPSFEVHAMRDTARFQVTKGMALKPKDRIRFVVNPGSSKFVMVASRDGQGAFSVYHPYGAQVSAPLAAPVPRRTELPGAVELDDTLGTEQLVAVFSDAPITARDVEAALSANPERPSVSGARVLSWEFVKEAP